MDAGGRATQEQLPSPETAASGVAFLLVTFLTPGFLPYALRDSCAVRAAPAAQWLLSLGHARESDSLAGGERKTAGMPRDEGA